jgi:predicted HTH transcriptional regulator
MLPKQKSYIPRFALILSCLHQVFDGSFEINKELMLKSEMLSDYFISQAKKIKFDSIEKKEAKKLIEANKDKTKKEQALEILKANPKINKTELAEMLEVSRVQIYNYIKDVQKS